LKVTWRIFLVILINLKYILAHQLRFFSRYSSF